jgi:serine/threonine protein kinase
VAFPCPYCRHSISVKSPKPGRYKPKCPACQKPFALVVAADGVATAESLDKTEAEKPALDPTMRMPPGWKPGQPIPAALGESDATMAPPPEPVGEQTGAFSDAPDGATMAAPSGEDAEGTAIAAAPTKSGDDAEDKGDFKVDSPTKMKKAAKVAAAVPETIGGYRVVKELGRGGMGAVYLAEQVSLDRPVALKIMNAEWGSDPAFVARFTREAYAAAQLTHHNIVQIYDFGKQREINYFSMEFVDGQSLGQLVKKQGKLDVEQAVGLALQAARGLRFAHDRGMVHRDIKPDNLMLNTQGIVKVADLGLVKTPGADEILANPARQGGGVPAGGTKLTNVTRVGLAMGTPAYMSPEQAKNAAGVDQRADIYSLGCTLYVMLTGRPPFQGTTVMEIISKHATAPLVPPDTIVKRVPKELSAIIQKMVAKRPEDRYADMGEVAKALEDWLGQKAEGANLHEMSEEQVSKLEETVKRFNDNALAKLRTPIRVGVLGGSVLFALLCLLLGWLKFSFAALAFGVETVLAAFLVAGFFSPSPLFLKVREYLFGCRWTTWLKATVALLLFLAVLFLFNLLWAWLLVTAFAAALGAGIYFGLDRTVAAQRNKALESAEELFKQLRLKGMDEEELRHFVCKYAGNNWEEFYEDLFGFEEKLQARDWWVRGQKGQARQKYSAWRESIVAAIDRRLAARKAEHERRTLQKLEEERLKAEGASAADAKAKAGATADRLVQAAGEIRKDAQATYDAEAASPRRPRKIAVLMLDDSPADSIKPAPPSLGRILHTVLNLVMGPTLRLLIGAVLLAGCLLWMYQNGLTTQAKDVQGVGDAWSVLEAKDAGPLSISAVPDFVTKWFNGYGAGVAGLLMLIGAFLPNWKAALLMPLAAIVAWLGPHLGVPDVGLSAAQLSMPAGGVIGLLTILVGRKS